MNEKYNPKIHFDRRTGPDFWLKALRWFGIIGWIILLTAIAILDKAKPETEYFLDRYFFQQLGVPIEIRTEWDYPLLDYVFFTMVLGLFISVVGLVINHVRNRRRDDHYRFYLLSIMTLSIIGIAVYWFKQ